MPKPVILCIDDERFVLASLKEQLRRAFSEQFDIETIESGEEALELWHELASDRITVPLIITDQIMPGMKGDELLIAIHELAPDTRKVLLTGQANADAVGNAVNKAGLYRYIAKPWEQDDLLLTVREATSSYFQSCKLAEQEAQYRKLVGTLNVGVCRIDPSTGAISEANPALASIFGFETVNDLMQTRLQDLSYDSNVHIEAIEQIRQDSFCKNLETRMKRTNGMPLWVSLSVVPTYEDPLASRHGPSAPESKMLWMDALVEDITERKVAQDHLINLNKAYQRFVPYEFLLTLGKKSILDVQLNDQVQNTMTVLFSDIRSFSTLSESMTPEETFRFITSYLSNMGPLVRANNGFIDKYIGDSIMALFDRKADDAVKTALLMLEALPKYNQGRECAGYAPIDIGIGVNTGSLILGILGEQHRMEGTVISDAVNAAARLEGLTKTYRVPLIISEHTLYAIDDSKPFHIRFIDRVQVQGKTENLAIYEVFNIDSPDLKESKLAGLEAFQIAMYHYHFGDVELAGELWAKYAKANPLDTISAIYDQRCRSMSNEDRSRQSQRLRAWDSDLDIGHARLDAQHKAVFSIFNRLIEIVCNDSGKEEFNAAVCNLETALLEHLTDEEMLMEELNYPGISIHKRHHDFCRENIIKFKHIIEQLGYKGGPMGMALLLRIEHLFTEWFLRHLTGPDKTLGNSLRN